MKRFLILLLTVIVIVVGWLPVTFASAAESTVKVRIEGDMQTVFVGEVGIEGCTIIDNSGNQHELPAMAACALQAAAQAAEVDIEFQDFGFGLLLQRIGEDNTPVDWSKSWSFWANDDMADVGIDTYTPSGGDNLLFAFTSYPAVPLRVQLPQTAIVGEPVDVKVQQRLGETDENWQWHGRWEEAPGAKVHVGEEIIITDASGGAQVLLTEEGRQVIWATGEGWVISEQMIVTVEPVVSTTPEPSVTPEPSTTPEPTFSPAPSVAPEPTATPVSVAPTPSPACNPVVSQEVTDSVNRGLLYLRQQQQANGMIDGEMVSAWSAMAFGAANTSAATVKQGESSLLGALLTMNGKVATDVERQILAVRASGANPRKFGGRDLVVELNSYFDGKQYGAVSLINDDIFALLALLAGGEDIEASNVSQTVRNIIAAQESGGLWSDNADLTAAAMQALFAYYRFGGDIGISEALGSARQALLAKQDKEGGFGDNSATTAWTSQALSLSDTSDLLCPRPLTALLKYQNTDGGFGWKLGDKSSSLMTAYAVPALLKKAWPIMDLETASLNITSVEHLYVPGKNVPAPVKTVIDIAKVSSQVEKKGKVAGTQTEPYDLTHNVVETDNEQVKKEINTQITNKSSATAAAGRYPPNKKPTALLMFSLANMGIGISITRLLTKIII